MAEITELGEAELLDSLILTYVVLGISMVVQSLGPFLINAVTEMTEL